jgi:hypothetical protein
VGAVFVKRLLSQAVQAQVEEEWIPPGLSVFARVARWERLTDEQKRLVRRVYEEFKRFAEGLDGKLFTEISLMRESVELSNRIGTSCRIFVGESPELSRHLGRFADDYYVDGAKTSVSLSVVHERNRMIGLRCYIGKDKDDREIEVHAEVPAELVLYTLRVNADRSAGSQTMIWIRRVRSKEPKISFWLWFGEPPFSPFWRRIRS